jgi:predicted transglutaminase-like cysteine proteinase
MLARLAACAAFLLVSPICTQIADADGPLPLPEITVEAAQGQAAPANPTETQTETPPSKSANLVPVHGTAEVKAAEAKPPIGSESAPALEPFGLDAAPVLAGEILAKWGGVETQIKAEKRVLADCRDGSWCPQAAQHFLAVVDHGLARSGRARIGIINREINLSIVPTSDLAQWGVPDRWSPPLETFTTQRGDCEDYAIAKYVALRAAGVPQTNVRLIVVRNNAVDENHAVVAVRLNGDWIILDNRWLALVRDRQMWRATPLFELDDNGVRRFIDPAPTSKLAQASAGSFLTGSAPAPSHFVSASYTPSQSGPGGSTR